MITRLREYDAGTTIEADVCVVGAGAAGITLALELDRCALNVCLVESGGFEPDRRTARLSTGVVTGTTTYSLVHAVRRVFGGATHAWVGNCTPLQPLDFKPRSWVRYSGWPFGYEDLRPYYERAQAFCDLGPFDYDPHIPDVREMLPPFDPSKLSPVLWHLSPPTRFGLKYRSALEVSTRVRVVLHANVTALRANAARRLVTGVDVSTLDGRRATIRASAVVLAAGGIENPRLLLLSNLGNEHDLVGRFFMEHPYLRAGVLRPAAHADRWLGMFRTVPLPHAGRGSVALAASPGAQAERGLLNGYVTATRGLQKEADGYVALARLKQALVNRVIPESWPADVANVLGGLDDVARGILAKINGDKYARACIDAETYTVRVHVEQAPDPENRVTLAAATDELGCGRAHVRWRLGAAERQTARVLMSLFAGEVARLGLGSVDIDDWVTAEPHAWPPLEVKHHHSGTTRMSDDPRQGVVDRNCRVHGVDNLYVAGSSVFPTAGYANPTLTIVAMALRLAELLAAGLGPGSGQRLERATP